MRDITDPRMLRAMAHPLRLKMMNDLVIHGPATATELADRLDESPANCSWHLRQLAKFGFIEEATDLPSTGRNRPWRWVPVGNRWGDPAGSPELARAGSELMTTLLGLELAERNTWDARESEEPSEWRNAAFTTQTITWLTAEELTEVHEKIREVTMRHVDRFTEPENRPDGARPVRLIAWGVPAR